VADTQEPKAPALQGTGSETASDQTGIPARPQRPAASPSTIQGRQFTWGTGRRKTSVARVRIAEGKGEFKINDRQINDYFSEEKDRNAVVAPLKTVDMLGKFDVFANVEGGGFTGQAGAVRMGLARALLKLMPDRLDALREAGHLTRDSRMKERKKYGRRGARRSFQFSKR